MMRAEQDNLTGIDLMRSRSNIWRRRQTKYTLSLSA